MLAKCKKKTRKEVAYHARDVGRAETSGVGNQFNRLRVATASAGVKAFTRHGTWLSCHFFFPDTTTISTYCSP